MGESELVMRRDEIQALQAVLCRPPNDEFDGHPEIRKRVLPFRFGRKPVIVPRVVTPLGSQAKLPGLRKSNSFKKLFAALKPVSETSDCKGCDRLLIDCVTPQDLKPA